MSNEAIQKYFDKMADKFVRAMQRQIVAMDKDEPALSYAAHVAAYTNYGTPQQTSAPTSNPATNVYKLVDDTGADCGEWDEAIYGPFPTTFGHLHLTAWFKDHFGKGQSVTILPNKLAFKVGGNPIEWSFRRQAQVSPSGITITLPAAQTPGQTVTVNNTSSQPVRITSNHGWTSSQPTPRYQLVEIATGKVLLQMPEGFHPENRWNETASSLVTSVTGPSWWLKDYSGVGRYILGASHGTDTWRFEPVSAAPQAKDEVCPKCKSSRAHFVRLALVCQDCGEFLGGC